MKTIPLYSQDNIIVAYAKVSDVDYKEVKKYKWHMLFGIPARRKTPEHPFIRLSRFLKNAPDGLVVDHRDRDKLNNQRSNLRICTQADNCWNVDIPKNNTSGYKGVTKRTLKDGRVVYDAQIGILGKRTYLGRWESPEPAALAYNLVAKKYSPKYELLNDVDYQKYRNNLYKKQPNNKDRQQCIRGHEFNEKNTYITKRGTRSCRDCHTMHERNWRLKMKVQHA